MNPGRWLAVIIVLFICACAAAVAGQAPVSSMLSARLPNNQQQISISSSRSVNSSGVGGFVVQSTTQGISKVLFLPSVIEHPTAITIVSPSRAAVVGDIRWDVQAFTIFDPTNAKVLGQPLCIHPALSPDGKTLAFVRFFPEHFVPMDLQTAVYAVLDLSGELGKAIAHSQTDVGEVVYPPSTPAPGTKSARDIHEIDGRRMRWLSNTSFTFTDDFRDVESDVVVTKHGPRWIAKVVSTRKEY